MKTQQWKNVSGEIAIELYRFAGSVWLADDDTETSGNDADDR